MYESQTQPSTNSLLTLTSSLCVMSYELSPTNAVSNKTSVFQQGCWKMQNNQVKQKKQQTQELELAGGANHL